MSLPEITAGMSGAKIPWRIKDHTGALMDDSGISELEYRIYDLTNAQVVRARGAVGVTTASGTLALSASDTQLNGSGSRERRRVCFYVNTNQFWETIDFWVVLKSCGG